MNVFSRKKDKVDFTPEKVQARVATVLGPGIHWIGDLHGSGGVRIDGTMQGAIVIKGLVIIGETGKVICPELMAETVVVMGTVQGNITCQKLEIHATGRVWGDVTAVSFSSEDGAFLRGQMRMEERIEITLDESRESVQPAEPTIQGSLNGHVSPEPISSEAVPPAAVVSPEAAEIELSDQRDEPALPEKPKLKSPWD